MMLGLDKININKTINNGLYNVMFGNFPEAQLGLVLLAAASGRREDFQVARLRDCILEHHDDGRLIRVHTRLGGGNRADYVNDIAELTGHQWYVRDADCEHDHTYADFYFRPPDYVCDEIESAGIEVGMKKDQIWKSPLDMGARFDAAIESLRTKDSDNAGSDK